MREEGCGFGELPRWQLTLADQSVLHRLRQAAEEVRVE
jgi:hypothetical protein